MSVGLPPIGFWSYASTDEADSFGWLRKFRLRLTARLRALTGDRTTKIWQDQDAIPTGADWQQRINEAIAESSFFVPIVTRGFLGSEWCCKELLAFNDRMQVLGKTDLIFPVHYINAGSPERLTATHCHDPAVLPIIQRTQWKNFTHPRWHSADLDTSSDSQRELLEAIFALADHIHGALTGAARPAPSPPPTPAIIRTPQPGDIMREAPDLPEMVLIPAGEFQMGIPETETKREGIEDIDKYSRPVHTVRIAKPFWLARYPVTRGEFAAFIQATGHSMPDEAWTYEPDASGAWNYAKRQGRSWRNPGFSQDDRHPVTCVSHADALAYVKWLNDRVGGNPYRLPSEAEWEYAARAGTVTARYWGNGTDMAHLFANTADQSLRRHMGDAAKYRVFTEGDDGYPFTSPVGSFQHNSFKVYDMLGNVWEWCADPWHDSYAGAPGDGSAWETNGDSVRRVLRGGSWDNGPADLRAGVRDGIVDGNRYGNAGFRPARTFLTS